ncbi:hypothetical protein [Anabaena catenula]|nr:hypothetical protein [Anabaena catenula]
MLLPSGGHLSIKSQELNIDNLIKALSVYHPNPEWFSRIDV